MRSQIITKFIRNEEISYVPQKNVHMALHNPENSQLRLEKYNFRANFFENKYFNITKFKYNSLNFLKPVCSECKNREDTSHFNYKNSSHLKHSPASRILQTVVNSYYT